MLSSTAVGWSCREAAKARLVDERFRRVLAEILAAKFAQCEVSFSGACGNALRQAAGRLLRHPKIVPDDLLAGHKHATVERCMGESVVVVAQDSSSYNYSSHLSTSGLGPLNDKANVMGIHQHSALAMTEEKFPLGVVHAKFWVRSEEKVSAAERRKQPITEKESYKWIETSRQVEELFEPYFSSGGRVVLVGDRESDIFDLLAEPRHNHLDLLVRAAQPRTVEVEGSGQICSLLEVADAVSPLGEYTIELTARKSQPARQARMQVRSSHVFIRPPQNGVRHKSGSVSAWVVQAKEIGLEGSDISPLEWTLITTLDASGMQAAQRIVRLYTCRWEIERLHYTMKTGCNSERLQMDDVATLCNVLALYMIVAWRLLHVTHLGRVAPDAPASQVVDETEQAVLKQATGRDVSTVADVIIAVARMVGYEPYKNGPPPGVKTIWLGLRKLEAMAQGWSLAMDAIRLNNYQLQSLKDVNQD